MTPQLVCFLLVFSRRLSFKSRRFGTPYRFHLHRQVPAYEDGTDSSETSVFKTQTPGKNPKQNILHKKQGESLNQEMTLHISDVFPVHHQESSTVHTAIGTYHTDYADFLLASSQHNLYDMYLLLYVQC